MNCFQDVGTWKKSKRGEIMPNRDNHGIDQFGCDSEFLEELEECQRNLLVVLNIVNHNLLLNNLWIPPTLCQIGPSQGSCPSSHREGRSGKLTEAVNPNTFNAKSASVMFFRTCPPKRIRELAKRFDL